MKIKPRSWQVVSLKNSVKIGKFIIYGKWVFLLLLVSCDDDASILKGVTRRNYIAVEYQVSPVGFFFLGNFPKKKKNFLGPLYLFFFFLSTFLWKKREKAKKRKVYKGALNSGQDCVYLCFIQHFCENEKCIKEYQIHTSLYPLAFLCFC